MQTALATDNIAPQITRARAATRQAVGAIRQIPRTIGSISDISTAIAAAERHSVAREMPANMQAAASGLATINGGANLVAQATESADRPLRHLRERLRGVRHHTGRHNSAVGSVAVLKRGNTTGTRAQAWSRDPQGLTAMRAGLALPLYTTAAFATGVIFATLRAINATRIKYFTGTLHLLSLGMSDFGVLEMDLCVHYDNMALNY
jgi:hypothetical protein